MQILQKTAFAALVTLFVMSLAMAAVAPAAPKDVEQYLLGLAKFTPAEVASFEAGQVIAKAALQTLNNIKTALEQPRAY